MKKTLLGLLVSSSLFLSALDITPAFQIVAGKGNTGPERMAVTELAKHLEKVFGKKMKIVRPEKADLKKPSIILETVPGLKQEEWLIRTGKNTLYIQGGYPRGLFYAMCEFLERFAGVRWFTAHEIKIPRAAKLTIPDNKVWRGAPAFPLQRHIGDSIGARVPNYRHVMFKAYHRHSYFPNQAPDKISGSNFRVFTNGSCHTFYKLTKAVPKDKEYMLPVDSRGRPVRSVTGLGRNQVCFSNKEFRSFAKKEVAKWIRELDEKNKKRNYKLPVTVIDLSQNDNANFCQCSGCRQLYKKYGALSGAVLEFVNDIASAFPDKVFQTFAYNQTAAPPKGIKARDNVMVHFAFLGADIMRPLSSKTNARFVDYYKKWDKVAKNKAIWAYHRLYNMTEPFDWPQACFWYIAEDVRFYHKFGMKKFYLETEALRHEKISTRAFHDLHVYLASRLIVNPYLDEKVLIREFMDYVYGPAAPEMKAYAAYLKKRLDAVPDPKLHALPLPARSCFDDEFFRTIKGFLDRAEAKARKAGDKKLQERITLERYPLNMAALNMWPRFGKAMGGDRNLIISQAEKAVSIFYKRYLPTNNKLCRQIKNNMKMIFDFLRNPIPIPPGMEKLDIIQIPLAIERRAIPDPDAWMGKTMQARHVPDDSPNAHHKHLLQFGIYDHTDKRAVLHRFFLPSELKQDEKYHLYSLGRFVPNVVNRHRLWGQANWAFTPGDAFKKAIDPLDPGRELEVFISLKVTGPAYVKNSKKPNDLRVDKIVIVKHGIVTAKQPAAAPEPAKKTANGKLIFSSRNSNAFILPAKGMATMGKAFVLMRNCRGFSSQLYKYEPNKKYLFSCSARMVSGNKGRLFIGMQPYDAKKRPIRNAHINGVEGSDTVLAAPAAKGTKVITVKNGSKWRKRSGTFVAFGAKSDRSDLPNRNIVPIRKGGIVKKGDVWQITLSQPLPRACKAGTALRQHVEGITYLYAANKHVGQENVLLRNTLNKKLLWPGMAYFRVMVLFVASDPRSALEFDNLECSIIK